jgi:hypothetical protein
MATNRSHAMHDPDLPAQADYDPEPDAFLMVLEHNALACWWRDHAGATGEIGARVIPRDIPTTTTDESDPIGLED